MIRINKNDLERGIGVWKLLHGRKPIYDPTQDLEAVACVCMRCYRISYMPKDYRDNFCRRCGALMKNGANYAEILDGKKMYQTGEDGDAE